MNKDELWFLQWSKCYSGSNFQPSLIYEWIVQILWKQDPQNFMQFLREASQNGAELFTCTQQITTLIFLTKMCLKDWQASIFSL